MRSMLVRRMLSNVSKHSTALPLLKSINNGARLVLASKSPRRKELLQLMGFKGFEVVGSSFAEDLDKSLFENPADYTVANAAHKAEDVLDLLEAGDSRKPEIVIGADTIVEHDSIILEKPADEADAISMLQRLSGSWHRVHTGVVLYVDKDQAAEFNVTTEVKFSELTSTDIQAYLSFGESWDKAGAYAIQGIGGQMISELKGCYFNVMGLPISALSTVLAQLHTGGQLGNISSQSP